MIERNSEALIDENTTLFVTFQLMTKIIPLMSRC